MQGPGKIHSLLIAAWKSLPPRCKRLLLYGCLLPRRACLLILHEGRNCYFAVPCSLQCELHKPFFFFFHLLSGNVLKYLTSFPQHPSTKVYLALCNSLPMSKMTFFFLAASHSIEGKPAFRSLLCYKN